MKQKLTSRKFWACVAGVVMGAAAAFGLDQEIITEVTGLMTALCSIAVYIWTEGRVDAGK